MGTPSAFKSEYPNAQISWLVRSDLASLPASHPAIDKVISFDRQLGFIGLVKLIWQMSGEGYTHLYDAHNNVRSAFVRNFFRLFSLFRLRLPPKILVRSKERFKRFLLFSIRKNLFPAPYRSIASFQKPLEKWLRSSLVLPPQFFIDPQAQKKVAQLDLPEKFIALAPSAAWEMKRWPIDHWKKLIADMASFRFVLLGGPDDAFCEDIRAIDPLRVINLAGKLSLQESCAIVERSQLLISNDTGLMHVADQLGAKNLALIGPTAFGYPYHSNSQVAEIALWCKPCSKDGRGKCFNELYKRCLVDLTVRQVSQQAQTMVAESSNA